MESVLNLYSGKLTYVFEINVMSENKIVFYVNIIVLEGLLICITL